MCKAFISLNTSVIKMFDQIKMQKDNSEILGNSIFNNLGMPEAHNISLTNLHLALTSCCVHKAVQRFYRASLLSVSMLLLMDDLCDGKDISSLFQQS